MLRFFVKLFILAWSTAAIGLGCVDLEKVERGELPNIENRSGSVSHKVWNMFRENTIICKKEKLEKAKLTSFVELQKKYLDVYCVSCHGGYHGGPRGVRIDPFDFENNEYRFLNKRVAWSYLAKARAPEKSWLYDAIASERMPPKANGVQMTDSIRNEMLILIRQWLNEIE